MQRFSIVRCLLLVGAIIAITFVLRTEIASASSKDNAPKQAALERVAVSELGFPACATGYEIGEYHRAGRWVLMSVVCWPAEQTDPDVVVPETILLAIAQRIEREWRVSIEGEPGFLAAL